MVVNVAVRDLLRAAAGRILTVDCQTAERSFEHRVGFHVPEGLVAAIWAFNIVLVLAQLNELVATLFAKASPANSALYGLLEHIQANATVKVILDLVLRILGWKLALKYGTFSLDCHEWFFIHFFP